MFGNVKVNYLKLSYCLKSVQRHLATRLFEILEKHKSRIPDDIFWHLFQLYNFLKIKFVKEAHVPNLYLQYLANKHISLVQNVTASF